MKVSLQYCDYLLNMVMSAAAQHIENYLECTL